jgi:hypothetical protein
MMPYCSECGNGISHNTNERNDGMCDSCYQESDGWSIYSQIPKGYVNKKLKKVYRRGGLPT